MFRIKNNFIRIASLTAYFVVLSTSFSYSQIISNIQPIGPHQPIYCRYNFAGGTTVSGNITQDTNWTMQGSPYTVIGDVTVDPGVTLTVEPCALIRFDGLYRLNVDGTLNVQGLENRRAHFTSNQSVPSAGDWQGIYFSDASNDASFIQYARIEYAATGVDIDRSSPSITNSVFVKNEKGMRIYRTSTSNVQYNIFDQNTQYGIEIASFTASLPQPTIWNNQLLDNTLFDVFMSHSGVNIYLGDHSVDARYNWWGSDDFDTIITSIWDHFDSSFRARVNFVPFLTGNPQTTISIIDNSLTNQFFDPELNQTSQINYYLNQDANMTVRIYDWETQTLVRTLVNNQPRAAGANMETFDGRDDSSQILPEAVYTYIITAQAGGKTGNYNPPFTPGLGYPINHPDVTPQGEFSAFKGERLEISYDLLAPSLVTISLPGYPNFVLQRPRDVSGSVEYWDGRTAGGQMVTLEDPQDITGFTDNLPVNILVIQRKPTVDITLLQSNPYLIRPLYNQITEISYTINEQADVSVSILSPDAGEVIKTLESAVSKSAGTYTVIWDGTNAAGQKVTEAGDYRVRVEVNSATGGSRLRDGNIRVLF